MISPAFLAEIPWGGWVFAIPALVVARPAALAVSFLGSGLNMREQVAAAWFGPKGFAAVVYGLLVLESQIPAGDEVFHLVAVTIVLSILAHSSTDVLVARWFDEPSETPHWHEKITSALRSPPDRHAVDGVHPHPYLSLTNDDDSRTMLCRPGTGGRRGRSATVRSVVPFIRVR